jgi:SAM-dependent methyltransferase
MGKEGRKHAEEHFASEIMVRKTEALYSGLLKTKMKKDRQVPRSFSHIYSLWKRIFRWGPKNWFLRIFWVLGLLITKPFKHGEEFIRYRMYKDISSVIEERSITGKTLSISHSLEICKYLQNCDIIEANYPEYNCLKLPFPDESFDCVVSDMVIEHIQGEPQETVDESYRILKKDGYLILTTNFIYPWHGCPGDFWRFTQDGLKYLCRHFSNIMASGNGGNRSFIIMRWLGLHKLPVPHFKYHPLHIMSCKINKDWPMVTWIIAKK